MPPHQTTMNRCAQSQPQMTYMPSAKTFPVNLEFIKNLGKGGEGQVQEWASKHTGTLVAVKVEAKEERSAARSRHSERPARERLYHQISRIFRRKSKPRRVCDCSGALRTRRPSKLLPDPRAGKQGGLLQGLHVVCLQSISKRTGVHTRRYRVSEFARTTILASTNTSRHQAGEHSGQNPRVQGRLLVDSH
jgi:hypothetical protein